jgi:hypothetical protein
MAINFPNNPTLNQTFTNGSDSWIWNGTAWEVKPVTSPSFTKVTVSVIDSADSSAISITPKAIFQTDVDVGNALSVVGDVTATKFVGRVVGNVTGNADTASTLATSINVNGVAFNGSTDVTVPSAANTLTGTAINTTVVDSNLSTVGTLTTLEVAGDITADANIVVAAKPTAVTHATNKKYVDSRAIAMSIAMS